MSKSNWTEKEIRDLAEMIKDENSWQGEIDYDSRILTLDSKGVNDIYDEINKEEIGKLNDRTRRI